MDSVPVDIARRGGARGGGGRSAGVEIVEVVVSAAVPTTDFEKLGESVAPTTFHHSHVGVVVVRVDYDRVRELFPQRVDFGFEDRVVGVALLIYSPHTPHRVPIVLWS